MEASALRRRGWSISAIARHLGRDRKTIRAYLAGVRHPGERRPAVPDSDEPVAVADRIDPARQTAPAAPTTAPFGFACGGPPGARRQKGGTPANLAPPPDAHLGRFGEQVWGVSLERRHRSLPPGQPGRFRRPRPKARTAYRSGSAAIPPAGFEPATPGLGTALRRLGWSREIPLPSGFPPGIVSRGLGTSRLVMFPLCSHPPGAKVRGVILFFTARAHCRPRGSSHRRPQGNSGSSEGARPGRRASRQAPRRQPRTPSRTRGRASVPPGTPACRGSGARRSQRSCLMEEALTDPGPKSRAGEDVHFTVERRPKVHQQATEVQEAASRRQVDQDLHGVVVGDVLQRGGADDCDVRRASPCRDGEQFLATVTQVCQGRGPSHPSIVPPRTGRCPRPSPIARLGEGR